VVAGDARLMRSTAYDAGRLSNLGLQRADLAHQMLQSARARNGLLVAGASYGSSRSFISNARERGLQVAVEIRRDSLWKEACRPDANLVPARSLLGAAQWTAIEVLSAETQSPMVFQAADLGQLCRDEVFRAVAFAPGSVIDDHGDLRLAVTSLVTAPLEDVVQCLAWVRWIRTLNRKRARETLTSMKPRSGSREPQALPSLVSINSRPNIRLARQQDQRLTNVLHTTRPPRRISKRQVIELFAGAGGLGLGFLLSGDERRRYRILASAEVQPIFVQTLRRNHSFLRDHLARGSDVPTSIEPLDLRKRQHQAWLSDCANRAGGVDVVIGGPPCQGFSMANRNSWSANNPNNYLVDTFLSLVRRLQPKFALLENVQGILWTERNREASHVSVADHVARALRRAGYWPFAKLLDAVWYGVPQHRARFFLLAIHEDVGYRPEDFGPWGPFPQPTHGPAGHRPYITVADAIGDLPEIGNGSAQDLLPYGEPSAKTLAANPYLVQMRAGALPGYVTDHVTSLHAQYVLERYRQIPEGGNWQAIARMLSNYANVERTHSNIYRRLRNDEPAITIGHYRKSMLVHPTQHRGLSLREAARLQSFPDWFRFAGTPYDSAGGLMHKQQQLANAVCPIVSQAIAEFLLCL
jgi:DNA-cytosine methyltransferase